MFHPLVFFFHTSSAIYLFLLFLNSWPLLALIITIYISVYKYIFLNIAPSICIMPLACMLLELAIFNCYWVTNWCAPPWGRLSLPLSAFLSDL